MKSLYIKNLDFYNMLMAKKHVDYDKYGILPYSTIASWTVSFENGYEIDLKMCSSSRDDDIWCEAVLFLNGNEICCTDVCDNLSGRWKLETNGQKFEFEVCKH